MSDEYNAFDHIPDVPEYEARNSGVNTYDAPWLARQKVDEARAYIPQSSRHPIPLGYGSPDNAAQGLATACKWLFKSALYAVVCGLILGLLTIGAMLLIHENRLWAERDPLHGGFGRTLVAWKLSGYHHPDADAAYGLKQLAQSVQGGLPAITGARLFKQSSQKQLAYTQLGYRCAVSEQCWSEAQTSPALGGIRTLAWAAINKLEKTAAPGPFHAGLASLRIYSGNQPATSALSIIGGLNQRYPSDADLAAVNEKLQNSWLLHIVAWTEGLDQP